MNKFVSLFTLFVVVLTVNGKTALAQASAVDECLIYAGGGGDRVFPVWTDARKVIVIPYGEKASVWLPVACEKGSGTWGFESPMSRFVVTKEITTDLAKGVRFILKAKSGKGRVTETVIIHSPARTFMIKVILAPTYDEAITKELHLNIVNLRKEAGDLHAGLVYLSSRSKSAYDKSVAAIKDSNEAKETAKDARDRTEAGVDMNFSFLASVFNPGKVPGTGAQIAIFGTLKKWNESNLALRLGGLVRFHSYEVTYWNSTHYLNKDGSYLEWDIAVPLQLQWSKVLRHKNWVGGLALDLDFGPMLRVTNHWDSIMDMDQRNDLLVVEGRRDTVFGFTAGIGFAFFFNSHVGLKGQFIWSGATQQVVRPGTHPARVEPWVNSLYFTVGLNIKF